MPIPIIISSTVGSEVQGEKMALIKCTNCGHSLSDKAVKCPKCGCLVSKASLNNGVVHIKYEGAWLICDCNVQVYVNDKQIGTYSIKNGFFIDVPFVEDTLTVQVKYGFRTKKHTFQVNPQQHYYLHLIYNRITGGLSIEKHDADATDIVCRKQRKMDIIAIVILVILFGCLLVMEWFKAV